jgi:hypothetical protein
MHNIKKQGIFLMFCASIFNLRELISLEMISMPLALTESRGNGEALWVSAA